jgi:hypothetical protein
MLDTLMGNRSRYGAAPSTISITKHPKLQISNCTQSSVHAREFVSTAVVCGKAKVLRRKEERDAPWCRNRYA